MDDNQIVIVLGMMIFAGVSVLIIAMMSRYKLREMEHRERLAMIDRGLIPSPETDPAAFEMRTGLHPNPATQAANRSRSLGVVIVALGAGLLLLITFAGEALAVGLGVGGAVMLLGAAFLYNGTMMDRRQPYDYRPPVTRANTPMPTKPEPPTNVAP